MTITFWQLGWRTLWRDVRSGDLRLLMLAVTLAVAALTAVGFFADRLKGGLQRDARQLLGGDAVVSSDNPTPSAFIALIVMRIDLNVMRHMRVGETFIGHFGNAFTQWGRAIFKADNAKVGIKIVAVAV